MPAAKPTAADPKKITTPGAANASAVLANGFHAATPSTTANTHGA
jgi:hypothetical protein